MKDAAGQARPKVLRAITRLNIGGPARHVLHLAKGMEGDFETSLLVGTPEPGEGSMDDLAGSLGIRPILLPSLQRGGGPLENLKAFWGLYRLCRRLRPDIVHTHTGKAGAIGRVAGWLAGVPVVLHTFHGHVLKGYFPPWKSRLLARIEGFLAGLSTRIYALSPSQRQELADLGAAPLEKIRVLPLGLDLEPLTPPLPRGRLRAEFGLPENALLIGCVGRLVAIKGHTVLLEAFRKIAGLHPDARLLLIGDGELRGEIASRIRSLDLEGRVLLTGFRHDLAAVYGDLDLAVLASFNEGQPVALIEAASAGIPIVATRAGGVGDLLEDHEGALLVPPGDAGALTLALDKALTELPRLRSSAMKKAEFFRSRYDHRRLCRNLTRDYRELLIKNKNNTTP